MNMVNWTTRREVLRGTALKEMLVLGETPSWFPEVCVLPFRILALNPGSTSTKVALFEDEQMTWESNVVHPAQELARHKRISDQMPMRLEAIVSEMQTASRAGSDLSAIAARGGLLRPVDAGTYAITENMVQDLREAKRGEHASNLGAIIAFELASKWCIPAYTVDPVSVDEFCAAARITGLPDLERKSLLHALNIRAVARLACKDLGIKFEDANLVVAHLGSGTSVCPIRKGRIIDVNNANEEGPFSTERAGSLPAGDLVRLCFSGKYTKEQLIRRITSEGGMYAHLGTKDVRETLARVRDGDGRARLVFEAMIYQTGKEIGAMATVLCGDVDAVVVSGGASYSDTVIDALKKMVSYIAPVLVYPGGDEMASLAQGVLRVLKGEESPRQY